MKVLNLVPRLAGFFLVAAYALATPSLAPIPGIVSTGVGLNQGAIDVNYLLISAPSGVPATIHHPVVICSVVGCDGGMIAAFPFANSTGGVWAADNGYGGSKWVGVNAIQYADNSGQAGPSDPIGEYIFRVTFVLPNPIAVSTAHISGSFSTDNNGEIWLNGVGLSGCQRPNPPYCFESMDHPFNIASGFVSGVNYLDFKVYNIAQVTGNPMGLRVDMTGTYEVPEPGTAALWVAGLAVLAVLRRRKAS